MFKVYIIDEDGDRFEQGDFESKEEAFALREKLIKDGFEYVAVTQPK